MNKMISMFVSLAVVLSSVTASTVEAEGGMLPGENTDRLGIEAPDIFARAELTLFQTIHGLVLGAELCALMKCKDERWAVGAVMGGGIGGLSMSLLNTENGITSGHTLMLNSGTSWGFWNALAINLIVDNWAEEQLSTGTLMAGQLGGLGSASYLWDTLRPQAGDVALMDSSGVWSGVLAVFAVAALDLNLTTQEFFSVLLAATDLGALAGAYLAVDHPMPRGRVFLINTGGVMGAAIGFGMAVMMFGEGVPQTTLFGSGFLGTLMGLGAGVYLSEGWKLDSPSKDVSKWVSALMHGVALQGAVN